MLQPELRGHVSAKPQVKSCGTTGVLKAWGRADGWGAGAFACGQQKESEEGLTALVGTHLQGLLCCLSSHTCPHLPWSTQAGFPETLGQRNWVAWSCCSLQVYPAGLT